MPDKFAFLNLNEDKSPVNTLLLLMIVAYTFSIAIRLIWVYQFSGHDQFYWNDQLMINTNDGYYYAEGARDILAGFHQENDLSPIYTPTSQLTAVLAKVIPVSFETLILYLPTLLGSLLVIPVLLIGRAINQTWLGFMAALLAGITWSYYNRTMTGYYDTDMLNIVLPTFVLWGIILAISQERNRYLLITTFTIITYQWWYSGSYSLNLAMTFMVFLYTMAFDKKNLFNYKLIIFLIIAVMILPIWLKITLSIGLFFFFHYQKTLSDKFIFYILGAAVLLLLFTGGLTPVLSQLKAYIFRDAFAADTTAFKLNFYGVAQTVREAGRIPFETFANRISGHTVTFLFSVIGYFLLAFRYRVMWLALPMVGLGFLAIKGGLRFTVYAVPIMALGMAYLLLLISKPIKVPAVKIIFLSLGMIAVLYPNIVHIIGYKVPTVFKKQEVQVLDQLRNIASREDYVLSWWDYGYPIRYYSDVKTLIDGGKHMGSVNFPVSYALTHPQLGASTITRMVVENTEKFGWGSLKKIMTDNNFTDSDLFLEALALGEVSPPQKSREIFFYLPLRMMEIYPTVSIFSHIDLKTGQTLPPKFFYQTMYISENGNTIDLGNGIKFDKAKGIFQLGQQSVPLGRFVRTAYDQKGKIQVQQQVIHPGAKMVMVHMTNYKRFLIMDEAVFNSTYIQLFVLEKYDKKLFEPVIMSPLAKVYRLKI